jgi:hypothetical protein
MADLDAADWLALHSILPRREASPRSTMNSKSPRPPPVETARGTKLEYSDQLQIALPQREGQG